MSSAHQRSPVPSPDQPSSLTSMPSQTPAQVLASALLSVANGVPGVSSQAGKPREGISDGQRQSASSFLLALSAQPATQVSSSGSLVTIEGSLRAGGKEGAETGEPTRFSAASTTSLVLTNALLSRATLPAKKIQPTPLPEGSTHQLLISSQKSAYQLLFGNLSLTSTSNPPASLAPSSQGAPRPLVSELSATTSRVRHDIPLVSSPCPLLLSSPHVSPNPLPTAQTCHLNPPLCVRTAWLETGFACGGLPRWSSVIILPLRSTALAGFSTSWLVLGLIPLKSRTVPASWFIMSSVMRETSWKTSMPPPINKSSRLSSPPWRVHTSGPQYPTISAGFVLGISCMGSNGIRNLMS